MEIKKIDYKDDKVIIKKRSSKVVLNIIKGVRFCVDCGTKITNEIVTNCDLCDGTHFLEGDPAEKLNAYFEISHNGLLKKHARNIGIPLDKYSGSNKRLIWKLMVNDGYFKVDDKIGFEFIQKLFWRRY